MFNHPIRLSFDINKPYQIIMKKKSHVLVNKNYITRRGIAYYELLVQELSEASSATQAIIIALVPTST